MARDVTKPRGPPREGAVDVTKQEPNATWDSFMGERMKRLLKPDAKLEKATLETTDIDFLREASEETFLVNFRGLGVRPMSPTQRKQKERFIKRLRAGFENASLIFEPFRNWRIRDVPPPWFDPEDIERVISPSDLYALLGNLLQYGGKQYRKDFRNIAMYQLGTSPSGFGWRIQFVRDDWPEE